MDELMKMTGLNEQVFCFVLFSYRSGGYKRWLPEEIILELDFDR